MQLVTFCVTSGHFSSLDNAVLLEGRNDCYVQIFIDDSVEPDFTTPIVPDTDNPRWDYCRVAVASTSLKFKVLESDTALDDIVGEATWSIFGDGDVRNHMLTLTNGYATAAGEEQLYIDATLTSTSMTVAHFCIRGGSFTNTENYFLNEGEDDIYVDVRVDGSSGLVGASSEILPVTEVDYQTPTVNDADAPTWADFCRTAAVRQELRFTIWDEDLVTDDLLGEASWQVQDGDVSGRELPIHGGTTDPPASGNLRVDVTLLPAPRIITFCIAQGSFTNSESALLSEGENDMFVRVFIDGSPAADYVTPVVQDADAPTWTSTASPDGYCRNAAVRSHITLEAWDDDFASDDLLGTVQWSVSDVALTSDAPTPISDGVADGCTSASCGWLYVSAGPHTEPDPSLIVSFSGRVTIGGLERGFTADLQGQIDIDENAASLNIAHTGGWSPISESVSPYLHQLFTTPQFQGTVALNVGSVFLAVEAEVLYNQPLVLIPGGLELGALDANTMLVRYDEDGNPMGPSINITLVQESKNSTFNYTLNLDCTMRIGSGDGDGWPPMMFVKGRLDPNGPSSLEVWTLVDWRPLPGVLPSFALPPFYGSIQWREGGTIDYYADVGPLMDIGIGSLLLLKHWTVYVEYVGTGPPAPPPSSQLNSAVSGAAGVLGDVVPPASPAPAAQLTLNVSGGIRILDSLEFNVTGFLDTYDQSASLQIDHAGGWCPFASFGLDFCTPALQGVFGASKNPTFATPYLRVGASVILSDPVTLITSVDLRVTSADTTNSDTPVYGTGGPTFGVTMFQRFKNGPQFFEVFFNGGVCVNMTTLMCFPVRVNVVRERPRAVGKAGGTGSRRLDSLRLDPPLGASSSSAAAWRHHSLVARRIELNETLGEAYYAVGDGADVPSELSELHGRRASAGFGSFVFDGRHTSGDIKPLAPILPASLADVIVIKGTEALPIEFRFTIDPFGGDICNLIFELSATLQFSPPPILGLGQLLLPVTADGCLAPSFAAIFTSRLPAIHLPGDMVFDGLTLLLSTYDEVQGSTITTVSGDKNVMVPSGMSMHWEGKSPLSVLCPVDVELSFTFQSSSTFGFSFGCPEFSLTLFDAPPVQIKSTNFIRFTAIHISAFVAPTEVQYSLSTSFQLATGTSDCSRSNDAECVRADVSASVGIDNGMTFVVMQLNLNGLWIEPLRLRNFAILDPQLTLDVQIPPPPAVPIPRVVAWAANIYYKPDVTNSRSNWPAELLAANPTSDNWPPNLDSYASRNDEKAVLTCESFFLYEQWHDELSDSILRQLGLPRFAMKLRIPRLTLIDVLTMYADIQASSYAARGLDVGGAPAAAATLLGAVKPFLQIEMRVDAELSLIEMTEADGGVAEWGGEPVHRGLKLNMTVEASNFLGFSFDIVVLASVRLPNPSPELQSAFITMLGEFFQNPMGIVTGEVVVPNIDFTAGMSIEALATLPFFPSRLYFFGKITTSSFELRAAASFAAGPFSFDVTLEVVVASEQLRLAFGGALDLGPLGSVSVYGEMQANPAFFTLNGTFCKPMFGIPMSGSAAIDSRTGRFGFEARAVVGFFGLITLEGGIETNPAAPNGVHLRGMATISLESLHQMVDDLIRTIVRAIAGTSDPETSLVAKALMLLFQFINPLYLLRRGRLSYDNLAGSMGIELELNIFGERSLGFSLPTPIRRRALREFSAAGKAMADWPDEEDTRLNATRRRALSSSCAIGPPEFPMSVGAIVDEVANTFNNLVAMASNIAPIDYSFEFDVNLVVLSVAGYVRFTLATSGHMSLELAAALYFIGIRIEGDMLLSTEGGVVSGRLYGAGTTPKLCGACPVLNGSVEVKKTPPEQGSVVSVGMDLEMTMGCLVVRGSALMDTAGGLRSLLLEANNPMCLVDVLRAAINSFVPGADAILGDSLSVSVQRVRAFYSGAMGAGLTLTIDAELMEQRKSLTLKASGELSSVGDFLRMLEENAMALIEAFDDVLNVVSLTFFDITLGHAPVSWSAEIGDRNIANTGKGVTIGGSLRLTNSAWARMGLFGGGFGVDMDNYVEAGGFFMGSTFSMFHIELALKVDATFRNPLAEDLAELAADVADSSGARDLLNSNNDGRSINKEAMADIKLLRDASCALKEAIGAMLGGLTARLGRLNETDGSLLARRLPAIVTSMDALATAILASLEHAADVREATESNDGLRALKRILEGFHAEAAAYFGDRSAAARVASVQLTTRSVSERSTTMLLGLRQLPAAIRALVLAANTLVEVLSGDTATQLAQFTQWGTALSGAACLLKRTPDLGSQMVAIEAGLFHSILEPMHRIGRDLRLTRQPIASASSPPAQACTTVTHARRETVNATRHEQLARSTFAAYDSLCSRVQWILVSLAGRLGQSGLASYAELTKAINARRYRHAAALLSRSSLCTSGNENHSPQEAQGGDDDGGSTPSATFCNEAAATLTQGCGLSPRWVRRPDWLAAALDVRLLGFRASGAVQQTLELQVAVNTSGVVSCPETSEEIVTLLRQVQPRVNMTFYTSSASAMMTEALAMATVNAMHMLPNGMLSVRSSQLARWWAHHTPLFVDATTVAQTRAEDICARADASPLVVSDGTRLLAAARSTPFTQALLMSGQSQRPWPLVVAPGRVCWVMCRPGLSPTPVGDGLSSADALGTQRGGLPAALSGCLQFLRRDYATCTIDKSTADLRFARCAGAPEDAALHDWLQAQLLAAGTSENATSDAVGSLDCEAFAEAKARQCVCSHSSEAVTPLADMRPIENSVGMPRDPNATNRPADVVAVRERLLSLGYGRGFSPGAPPADSCEADLPVAPTASSEASAGGLVDVEMQVRLMRVLLCAAAGVWTFEDQCDALRVNGYCAINGVECPRLARTARDTCLRLDEPCANALVAPGSPEHDWLRAHGSGGTGAPGWVTIPAAADGFELAEDAALTGFGTTWLLEALTVAGRRLTTAAVNESAFDMSTFPLMVLAASGREGGLLPDERSHQTGLELRMRLPLNGSDVVWPAVREQVAALEAAGFARVQLKGAGETQTCQWKSSLCVGSRARMGEMIASVAPPLLAEQMKVPRILSSQLVAEPGNTSALLSVRGLDIGNAEQIVRLAIGDHECELVSFELRATGFQLTATCAVTESERWLGGRASVATASDARALGAALHSAFLRPFSRQPLPPHNSTVASNFSTSTSDHASVRRYEPMAPRPYDDLGALRAPTSLRQLQALQLKLHGWLPTCLATHVGSATNSCSGRGGSPPAANVTPAAALIPWPVAQNASTTMFDLLALLCRLDPHGLGGDGVSLPTTLRYLRASSTDGCIATLDLRTRCPAGVHATFAVEGFLDAAADASITAALDSSRQDVHFTALVLDVVVREDALSALWPSVRDGIIAALPLAMAEGASRFFERLTLASASLRYTTSAPQEASLTFVLTSDVMCSRVALNVSLDRFASFVSSDERIGRQRLEQVLSLLASEALIGTFTSNVTAGLDFSEAVDVLRLVHEAAAAAPLSNATLAGSPGAALSALDLKRFFERAGVCEMGLFLRYAELQPPNHPSQLCEMATEWFERAAVIKAAIADAAACGVEPAASQWRSIVSLEERFKAMHSQLGMSICMRNYGFLEGLHTSVSLPSRGVSYQLREVDRALGGLEAAWLADDGVEVNELLPQAVELLRGFDEWSVSAVQITDIVSSVGGLLRSADDAQPMVAVRQLRAWGSSLADSITRARGGMPDASAALSRIYTQVLTVFPRVERVANVLAGVAQQVSNVVDVLRALKAKVNALRPQAAFVALTQLSELERIDFERISRLLAASEAFMNNAVNLRTTMGPHRTRLDSQCTQPSSEDCPLQVVRDEVAHLRELLAARPTSAPQRLAAFPGVVATVLGTLVDDLRTTSRQLARCASAVSTQTSRLPAYLDAADDLITGPALRLDAVTKTFFSHVDEMLSSASDVMASIALLQQGRNMTEALVAAAAVFTPSNYDALSKETTRLYQFFTNFAAELMTPDLQGMVTFVHSLLSPAVSHITSLTHVLDVAPYFDYMLALPAATINRLTSAAFVDTDAVPRLAELAPDPEQMSLATQRVFSGVSDLHQDLSGLLERSSTCLTDAMCLASLQIRVRAMRKASRELRRRLAPITVLVERLKKPLHAFIDLADFSAAQLPDLEIFGVWTRSLDGLTASDPASNHSLLSQQLSRAMCKDSATRTLQGRPIPAPAWFNPLRCAVMDMHLLDGPSVVGNSLEQSAKASPLFAKLAESIRGFTVGMQTALSTLTALINSGEGAASELVSRSAAFTSSASAVYASFAEVQAYVENVAPIMNLTDGIVALEEAVEALSTDAQLKQMSYSAAGALRHYHRASAPPFRCVNVPLDCDASLGFVPQIEASAAELNWDRMRSLGDVVPMMLLTGLGDGICYLRVGADHVKAGLESLTEPLEKLIEFFLHGPAALRGEAPQCAEGDAFCLATVPRANPIYRLLSFPIFYLHFWSLGTPPPANPCMFVMANRFTIPGLWSTSSMQSSTLLSQSFEYRGFNQCSRYTHLLAYAPSVPGGCTASYVSFLATADQFGALYRTHPIRLASGQRYAGTLSGVAVSRELGTVWACGKEQGDLDFSLFTFRLADIDIGFGRAPLSYETIEITPCHVATLRGMRGTPGKEVCHLHWDKKKQWLWTGNTAQPGERGQAAAHNTAHQQCGSGGMVSAMGPHVYSRMDYGPHVTSFTFLTDVLGDDYLSLARCDNFNSRSAVKPCKLEFHEVPTPAAPLLYLLTYMPRTMCCTHKPFLCGTAPLPPC
jgi:hypothetical protein